MWYCGGCIRVAVSLAFDLAKINIRGIIEEMMNE